MSINIQSLETFGAKLLRENLMFSATAVLSQRDQYIDSRVSILMTYLFAHCSKRQSRTVSYLMNEFTPILPAQVEADLRCREQAMYMKYADPDGIARVLRRLERLDSTI